jgi:DNA polymerase elongation subunit (family B)
MGWNSSTSIDSNTNDTSSSSSSSSNEDDIIIDGNNFINNTKCDLGILYERCEANGIDNIVFKSKKDNRTYYSIPGLNHIDLYQVYNKVMVQDTIYNA